MGLNLEEVRPIDREVHGHEINDFNRSHVVIRADQPGNGGASHIYAIALHTEQQGQTVAHFRFQDGPVKEAGPNGISDEALLVIVIDRLQGFQRGQYSCRENALAITKLEEALHWLHHRTLQREARGVEGTHRI
jgi:hypothetical protein